MAFIELSLDQAHGGTGWEFGRCIWAPPATKKRAKWPFWTKVASVQPGDTILHIRGKAGRSNFVGFSTVDSAGGDTLGRPPQPGSWEFSASFLRAELKDYTAFTKPISVQETFRTRRAYLEQLFAQKGSRNYFYNLQAGRLQCLNGAYLSDLDDELWEALSLGNAVFPLGAAPPPLNVEAINTGEQLAQVQRRLGQERFSNEVKRSYGYKCCFPGCNVDHPRFLIGSHIARWADNVELRGELGNGLCLCLNHDKAFEIGLFTLDLTYRVVVNDRHPNFRGGSFGIQERHGEAIQPGRVAPMARALEAHWRRIGIMPV